MRIFKFAAIGVIAAGVALGGSVFAAAQSDDADATNEAISEAAAAPTTGEIQITFKITFRSTFPSGSVVSCLGLVEATSINSTAPSGNNGWGETAVGTATVSGASATCTATIPYSWILQSGTGAKNFFSGFYDVIVLDASGKNLLGERSSSTLFAQKVAIPASGTTTKYALNVTI